MGAIVGWMPRAYSAGIAELRTFACVMFLYVCMMMRNRRHNKTR